MTGKQLARRRLVAGNSLRALAHAALELVDDLDGAGAMRYRLASRGRAADESRGPRLLRNVHLRTRAKPYKSICSCLPGGVSKRIVASMHEGSTRSREATGGCGTVRDVVEA
jgi:hypothetical protein